MAELQKTKWYYSKTLWANAIAAIAMFIQSTYGYPIDPEIQGYILIAINVILRSITKTELTA
jgi:hypothetical protein